MLNGEKLQLKSAHRVPEQQQKKKFKKSATFNLSLYQAILTNNSHIHETDANSL